MQYVLTPYSDSIQPFVVWENGFSKQELNWLQAQAKNSNDRATVGGNPDPEQLSKIRRSQISWLNCTAENRWLFEKIGSIVSSLNAQFYQFELTGFGEAMQLTNYDQSEEGMYGWHVDYGGKMSPSRKLSVVLQLSDPSEYDGGNLQVCSAGPTINVSKQRGLLVAFPSYVLHQVTPVTSGSRQTLVAWISGPKFR